MTGPIAEFVRRRARQSAEAGAAGAAGGRAWDANAIAQHASQRIAVRARAGGTGGDAAGGGGANRYPDNDGQQLVAALSQRLGVAAGRIVLGAGSNELLYASGEIALDPGDEGVAPDPGFVTFAPGDRACAAASMSACRCARTAWSMWRPCWRR